MTCRNEAQKIVDSAKKIYPYCITLGSKSYIAEVAGEKYFLKSREPVALAREADALFFLKQRKFKYVPRFYGIAMLENRQCLVQDFIKGDEFVDNKNLFEQYIAPIKNILRELYRISQVAPIFVLSECEKRWGSLNASVIDTMYTARQCRNSMAVEYMKEIMKRRDVLVSTIRGMISSGEKVPAVLVNGEKEFIVSSYRKVFVVDWENSYYGDMAYDLASLKYAFSDFDILEFSRKNWGLIIGSRFFTRSVIYLQMIVLADAVHLICQGLCFKHVQRGNCFLQNSNFLKEISARLRMFDDGCRQLHLLKKIQNV